MKIIKWLLLTMISLCFAACSGSTSESSGNTGPGVKVAAPLTIDNTGVVPAFSDSSTAVKVYLHNNTNRQIKNINYKWQIDLPDNSYQQNFLNANSLASKRKLSSVAAYSYLALPISVPAVKATFVKGSALLTISYSYNGQQYSFSHVVNFQLVPTGVSGVKLTSGAVSSSFGNSSSGYTTLYVYGGGSTGTTYSVTSVQTDPILGQIVQGNLSGSQVVSHQVVSVELNTAGVTKTATGQMTITSQDSNSNTFRSTKAVAVLAMGSSTPTPLVIPSLVPFIDTATTSSAQVFFYNAGTATATLSGISPSSGVTVTNTGSSCSSGFGPGQTCIVSFSVSGKRGSGTITATDQSGNNLSIQITWYNSSVNVPQLGLSSDADSIPFILHGTNPYTGTTNVTLTNLSTIPVTNIQVQVPQVQGGSATAALESAANCTGHTLTTSSPACSYAVAVSDTVLPDNGIINLSAAGTAGTTTVPAIDAFTYTVYQSTAQLQLIFSPTSLSIYGDAVESRAASLTITNLGTSASADISSLNEQPVYISVSGNPQYTATTACNGQPLAHGASCQENIVLQAQSYESGSPLQATLNYTVAADGVTPTQAATPLQMTVQAYSSAIALTTVTPVGNSGGNGKESTTQVTYLAGTNSNKQVVLTYTNLSTAESMTVSAVSFASGLPAGWYPKYAAQDPSSCYSNNGESIGATLAPGATCTVTLINQLYLLGDTNNTTNLSFNFPTLTINSNGSNQYSFVPGNQLGYTANKYYAQNNQAVIIDTDSIESNGSESAMLVMTHTATGVTAGGYGGNITEKTVITPQIYLSLAGIPDTHCSSVVKESGAVVETCSLADGYTASNNYNVIYASSESVGVSPTLGGTLTVNYFDMLTGQAWAYNNDATVATGVNGGGDYVTILPLSPSFIFGGYSQWLYESTDNTVYTFQNNSVNGAIFESTGYIESAFSNLFSNGINAIDSAGGTVLVATGGNTNRITSCSFNQSTGVINTGSCQALTPVSGSSGANLTDIVVSRGNLYVLDNKGIVTLCPLTTTGSIISSSCHATATDAPALTIGSGGRQQRLMFWDSLAIYTEPSTSNTQYVACTQEVNGELDNCQQLNLDPVGSNTTAISTTVLLPAANGYAYLYTMSNSDSVWYNQGYGCVLNKSSASISVSNCVANPLLPTNYVNMSMKWGGIDGGNATNHLADQYVIYYDPSIQHMIGTVTSSNTFDLATNAMGEEFYLIPGVDYTIEQPSYLQLTYISGGSHSWYISSSTKYNANLNAQIKGGLAGTAGTGNVLIDTFSIP